VIFTAHANGWADVGDARFRCAFGVGGLAVAGEKREGDGASPMGAWPLRRVLFRSDRRPRPATVLPASAIRKDDGWCDAPGDRNYNRAVSLPYPASAEALWREDAIYDLMVILGYNDDPVVDGAGSAIFLHLAREDFAPTKGCVAMPRAALETLLTLAVPGDRLVIGAP